jgi:putative spermidine/putrescine transport system permease protein
VSTRIFRIALFGVLFVAAIAPLVFLVLVSLGVNWFYPALVPPTLDLAPWRDLASVSGGGQRLARATASSLYLAIATGVLAATLALPVGRALARLRGWRRSLGAAAAFLPVAAPPIALGVGLQYSLLSLGVGGSHSGVLLAHLVPAVGYTSLFFLGIFSIYDFSVEEEARTLGASGFQRAFRVTIPLMRRPLLESFALGFLVSWAQVPLTLLVGQGMVTTLAVEVLSFAQSGQDRLAATGAILLIVPALLMLALVGVAIRRAGVV